MVWFLGERSSEYLPNGFIFETSLRVFTFGAIADFPLGLHRAGFKFDINGNAHFGWVELYVSPFSMEFNNYAYEDIAGHSIMVGATTSSLVPIPASLWFYVSAVIAGGCLKRSRTKNIH